MRVQVFETTSDISGVSTESAYREVPGTIGYLSDLILSTALLEGFKDPFPFVWIVGILVGM